MPLPKGLTSIKDANAFHRANDAKWDEAPPPNHPEFVERWFLRCQELIDKYQPDLLYFDNTELPLGQAGLDIAAHYYNSNMKHRGHLEAVLNSKGLQPEHVGTMVLDIERGKADQILPNAWQTDTVYRGLALQALDVRKPQVQDRAAGGADVGRYRQQERESAAEHSAPRRWLDRRG